MLYQLPDSGRAADTFQLRLQGGRYPDPQNTFPITGKQNYAPISLGAKVLNEMLVNQI